MSDKLIDNIKTSYLTTGLITLSLDLVLPYYESFGLYLSRKSDFHNQLQFLFKMYNIQNLDLDSINHQDVVEIVQALETGLSTRDQLNLYSFFNSIYHSDTEEYFKWHYWQDVMRLSVNDKLKYLQHLIEPRFKQIIPYFKPFFQRETNDSMAMRELALKAQAHLLTEWDCNIFTIHNFKVGSDSEDPLEYLYFASSQNEFQIFWMNKVRTLNDFDLETVYRVCNNIQQLKSHQAGENFVTLEDGEIFKYEYEAYKAPQLADPKKMIRKISTE